MINADLVIIGGGPAGMAAAVKAKECGVENVLITERDEELGGVLRQCIHNGFGLHKFKEELTGPEYSNKLLRQLKENNASYMINTTVTGISADKVITAVNAEKGIFKIKAKAVILATGCRERPRGALNIPGKRPSGIYTAGTAQKFINMKGVMPGSKAVILGSGDIGLIMARRMTLEGAKVEAVCEIMPYSGGLTRNIVQCLNDFDIPLKLSHTVVEIHGDERLTGVTIAEVDDKLKPIKGTEQYIECDTLLLSVGLIPENELAKTAGIQIDGITGGAITDEDRETSIEGIFACGNALHVHDLADYASEEAEIAGEAAAKYILGNRKSELKKIDVFPKCHARYAVPQKICRNKSAKIYFRVDNICNNAIIEVRDGDNIIFSKKKDRLAPGEMEYLILTADMTDKIINDSVTLEVRENG